MVTICSQAKCIWDEGKVRGNAVWAEYWTRLIRESRDRALSLLTCHIPDAKFDVEILKVWILEPGESEKPTGKLE